MAPSNTSKKPVVDDEYKEAIQPVVDDSMRTDVLGPHFCRILKDHRPVSEDIVKLVSKEVVNNPELKKSIKTVVDERNVEKKVRWVDRALGVGGTIIVALIIWAIQNFAIK